MAHCSLLKGSGEVTALRSIFTPVLLLGGVKGPTALLLTHLMGSKKRFVKPKTKGALGAILFVQASCAIVVCRGTLASCAHPARRSQAG